MGDDEVLACVADALGRSAAGGALHPLGGKQGLLVCRVTIPGAPACVFKAVRQSGRKELRLTAFLAARVPGAVPEVIAYQEDEDRDLYWLITLDKGSRRLGDAPSLEGYMAAAEALARIQLAVYEDPAAVTQLGVRFVDPSGWEEIALRTLEAAMASPNALVHRYLPDLEEAVWESTDVAYDTAALPACLIHGDLHAQNVVWAAGQADACLLDWGSSYVAAAVFGIEELLWPAQRHLRNHGDQGRVRAAYYRAMAPAIGKPGRIERAATACAVLMRLQIVQEYLLRPATLGLAENPYVIASLIGSLNDARHAWKRVS